MALAIVVTGPKQHSPRERDRSKVLGASNGNFDDQLVNFLRSRAVCRDADRNESFGTKQSANTKQVCSSIL